MGYQRRIELILLTLLLLNLAPNPSADLPDNRPSVYLLCISADGRLLKADNDYLAYSFEYVSTNMSALFPDFQLKYVLIKTDGASTGSATKAFIDGYLQPPNKALIIGAAYSQQSQAIADIAKMYQVPQIGYINSAPDLSDATMYPYYLRVSPTSALQIQPTIELLKRFNWRRIGIVSSDNAVMYQISNTLAAELIRNNITTFQQVTYSGNPTDAIVKLLKLDIRIFVILRVANFEHADHRFGCALKDLGAFGPRFVWIQMGHPHTYLNLPAYCSRDDQAASLEGSIEFDNYVTDPSVMETAVGPAGATLSDIYKDFILRYPGRLSDSVPNTFDGINLRFDSVLAAAIALNTTLTNHNYTEELQLTNSSFKAALLKNLLELKFLGLSGPVRFKKNGDRSSLIHFYQIKNMTRKLVATYDPVEEKTSWLANIWFAGGSPPIDEPQLVRKTLTIGSWRLVLITSLSTAGIFLTVAFMSVNFHFRRLPLIKLSSPHVNSAIGVGCILCYASCLVMACNSYWSTEVSLCWLQGVLLSVGYSLAYGAMFAKTWRVHRIFTERSTRGVAIKDWQLYLIILGLVALDIAIFAARALINPMWLEHLLVSSKEMVDDKTKIDTFLNRCSSDNEIVWIAVILGVKGALLLLGIFLAWETRSVHIEELNDSKNIGICVYNTMVMGVIGVVLEFALLKESLELQVLLSALCIVACASATLGIVFGSKVFQLMQQRLWQVGDQPPFDQPGSSFGASSLGTRQLRPMATASASNA